MHNLAMLKPWISAKKILFLQIFENLTFVACLVFDKTRQLRYKLSWDVENYAIYILELQA